MGFKPVPVTRRTARSVSGSVPTSVAGSTRPSPNESCMSLALATTWSLVNTYPPLSSALTITPEPKPACSPSFDPCPSSPSFGTPKNRRNNGSPDKGCPLGSAAAREVETLTTDTFARAAASAYVARVPAAPTPTKPPDTLLSRISTMFLRQGFQSGRISVTTKMMASVTVTNSEKISQRRRI